MSANPVFIAIKLHDIANAMGLRIYETDGAIYATPSSGMGYVPLALVGLDSVPENKIHDVLSRRLIHAKRLFDDRR